jgi:transposase
VNRHGSEKLDQQIEQLQLEHGQADQAPRKKSVRPPLPEHLPRDE